MKYMGLSVVYHYLIHNILGICRDPHVKNSRLKLRYDDSTDTSNITSILRDIEPDKVYNLGTQ